MSTATKQGYVQRAMQALKENIVPGLCLQTVMFIMLGLYFWNAPAHAFFEQVAEWKKQSGYLFAAVGSALAGGLLPQVMKVLLFQRGRVNRENLYDLATLVPFWVVMGTFVDIFYRAQALLFGTDANLQTIVYKVCFDMFVYTPFFANPIAAIYLAWRQTHFDPAVFRNYFTLKFLLDEILSLLVSNWFVWIPIVSVVYSLPSAMQIPAFLLALCFWSLVIITLTKKPAAA